MSAPGPRRAACALAVALTAAALLLPAASSAAVRLPKPAHATVVGGVPAAEGSFPSAAFVAASLGGGLIATCTGTVISPHLVLTAAHCAQDDQGQALGPDVYRVATGVADIANPSGRQVWHVQQVIVNPAYNRARHDGDVALLVLTQPTTAPPIMLPVLPDAQWLTPGQRYGIAGWGDVADDASTSVLHVASTQLGTTADCTASNAGTPYAFDAQIELCTNDPAASAGSCHGDSGGPLYVFGGPQIGVLSSGPWNCDPSGTAQYTRIGAILPWLDSEIATWDPPGASPSTPAAPAPGPPPLPRYVALSLASGRSHVHHALLGIVHYQPGRAERYRESCRHTGTHGDVACAVTWRRGRYVWAGGVIIVNTPVTDSEYGVTYGLERRTTGCRPASSSRCTRLYTG